MSKTTVQLVSRGKQHPYVIEVTTPGWRGCDHVQNGTVKETMPLELKQIANILKEVNVKYYSVRIPDQDDVMIFMEDGATDFVLRSAADFESALKALVRAGWLSAQTPPHPTIH